MQETGSKLAGPWPSHWGPRQENTLRKEREDGGHESHTTGARRDSPQTLPRQEERTVSDDQRGKYCHESQLVKFRKGTPLWMRQNMAARWLEVIEPQYQGPLKWWHRVTPKIKVRFSRIIRTQAVSLIRSLKLLPSTLLPLTGKNLR